MMYVEKKRHCPLFEQRYHRPEMAALKKKAPPYSLQSYLAELLITTHSDKKTFKPTKAWQFTGPAPTGRQTLVTQTSCNSESSRDPLSLGPQSHSSNSHTVLGRPPIWGPPHTNTFTELDQYTRLPPHLIVFSRCPGRYPRSFARRLCNFMIRNLILGSLPCLHSLTLYAPFHYPILLSVPPFFRFVSLVSV